MGLLDFLLGGDDSSSDGGGDWDRSVFDSDRFRNNGILRVLQLRLWLINKLKPSFLYVYFYAVINMYESEAMLITSHSITP